MSKTLPLWLALLVALLVLDFSWVVANPAHQGYRLFYPASELATQSQGESVVAVVRSNTPGLPNPQDPDDLGSYIDSETIYEMVRLAVELTGGIESIIDPKDRLVLLKPNLVEPRDPGDGSTTDPRVVGAMIRLIHQAFPNVEIVVGEGPGGYVSPEYREYQGRVPFIDGFERMGYREMEADLLREFPRLKLSLVDLNYPRSEMRQVQIPDGQWWYQNSYYTHRLVLEADKVISFPVMKIHGTQVTLGLKNNIGFAPGVIYGWAKFELDHDPKVIDKVIVDLSTMASVDYVVLDAITALEKWYTTPLGGQLHRNMIIAGHDIVAVDSVGSRLMGHNPDDIGHLTMARLSGLGIQDLEQIQILGESIDSAAYLFQKNIGHEAWLGRSNQGQSNRFWIFNSARQAGSPVMESVLAGEIPRPGQDGWTEILYASDCFMDISQAIPRDRFYYAFTQFVAPEDQWAELRVGSSGRMRVWIDGEEVYSNTQLSRTHVLYNDIQPIYIGQGEHTLLVEVGAGTFSLTIAEPVPNLVPQPDHRERYSGTRVHGLRFFIND